MCFRQYVIWFAVIQHNEFMIGHQLEQCIQYVLYLYWVHLNLMHLHHWTLCICQYTCHFLLPVWNIYRDTCFIATSQCQLGEQLWLSKDASLCRQHQLIHQRFYDFYSKSINCQRQTSNGAAIINHYPMLMTCQCFCVIWVGTNSAFRQSQHYSEDMQELWVILSSLLWSQCVNLKSNYCNLG